MKKVLLVSGLLVSMSGFAQYANGIFTTKIRNGVGVEVAMSFKVDSTKVVNSNTYTAFFKETNTPNYIEKHPGLDSLELFLEREVSFQSLMTRFELKNGTSFDPINVPDNMIYISPENNVNVSFAFKAQNGYGNLILGKAIATSTIKDGKIERKVFIY